MESLTSYFAQPDAMNASQLAERIGVSKGRMSQLRNGAPWTPELALSVERATGGFVDAGELSAVIAQARGVV